jgi:hypothetical protein
VFSRCLNSEVILSCLVCAVATNIHQHQYELLDSLATPFATGEYRLLVIDSVMGCFRTDYTGRGELSERQSKLGQYLDKVKAMAEQFNLAVLMVNKPRLPGHTSADLTRQTKYSLTREQALYLPEQMAGSQLVDMFSPMLQQLVFYCERVEARSGWPRSSIAQVRTPKVSSENDRC